MTPDQRTVAARAASLLLRHPDAELIALLPTLREALADVSAEVAEPLSAVAQHRAAGEPNALAAAYVETFDFRRRCCLYLTYYTHGDTRARGQALARFAETYRLAGYAVADGELPDYLPAVLDLAAAAGDPGWRLLHTHRVGLDLLHAALQRDRSVYAQAVAAVRTLLPPPDPADHAAVRRLAETGPPSELVGLDPFPTTPTAAGGRR